MGSLKQTEDWALSTDINMILLALYYHNEDLAKMNGVWPEAPKPKPTGDEIKQFAKTHNAIKGAGKMKPASKGYP